MAKYHIIQQGETLPLIARHHGFLDWTVLEDLPENSELFETCDEAMLCPGMLLFIPDLDMTKADVSTGAHYDFRIPAAQAHVALCLLDGASNPIHDFPVSIHLNDEVDLFSQETTSAQGTICLEVPPSTTKLRLILDTPKWTSDTPLIPQAGRSLPFDRRWERSLNLGHMNPPTVTSGLHARLQNLGYYFGDVDDDYNAETRLAIYRFKLDYYLYAEDMSTGETPNGATIDKLFLEKLVGAHDGYVAKDLVFSDTIPDSVDALQARTKSVPSYSAFISSSPHHPRHTTIRIYPPADLAIDAHMHIQSNLCAPLPLVWGRVPLPDGTSRATLNVFGTTLGYLAHVGKFTKLGKLATNDIGDEAERVNLEGFSDDRHFPICNTNEDLLSPMIVLPMDMEFAHLDGYLGEPIYYERKSRWAVAIYEEIADYHGGMRTVFRGWDFVDPGLPRLMNLWTGKPYSDAEREAADQAVIEQLRANGAHVHEFDYASEHGDEDGVYYYFIEYDMDKWLDSHDDETCKVRWVDDGEYEDYEDFDDQLDLTRMTSVKHAWRYFPLYHYEPRRWQTDPGSEWGVVEAWDKPFDEVATKPPPGSPDAPVTGPFVGFKMYTPLGYRPLDPWLDRMNSYYGRCARNGIPILSHCTPGGMYTNERHLYYELEFRRNPEIVDDKDRRVEYFSNKFVSPGVWNDVLTRHPTLRLCLAHFVGDGDAWEDMKYIREKGVDYATWWTASLEQRTEIMHDKRGWLERSRRPKYTHWLNEMIDLINTYENVYTDISFFHADDYSAEFEWLLSTNPKLKHRINFGTDWYMVESSISGYGNYCRRMKKAIDEIGEALYPDDPISLWRRFTYDNPLRFYRLLEVADNFAAGLKQTNKDLAKRVPVERTISWSEDEYDQKICAGLEQMKRVAKPEPDYLEKS